MDAQDSNYPQRKRRRTTNGAAGYIRIWMPDHPRANRSGYVSEHILIASNALGRPVPASAVVHHVNGDEGDNRNANLVICENHSYHHLLHVRERALRAGVAATGRKCIFCKAYDDLANGVVYRRHFFHRKCCNTRARLNYHRKQKAIKTARMEG